jgi:hypothetical protein
MTYSLQLELEIFRLLIAKNREEARQIRTLSGEMREHAKFMRMSSRDGVHECIESMLKAQPITQIF